MPPSSGDCVSKRNGHRATPAKPGFPGKPCHSANATDLRFPADRNFIMILQVILVEGNPTSTHSSIFHSTRSVVLPLKSAIVHRPSPANSSDMKEENRTYQYGKLQYNRSQCAPHSPWEGQPRWSRFSGARRRPRLLLPFSLLATTLSSFMSQMMRFNSVSDLGYSTQNTNSMLEAADQALGSA